MPLSRVVAIGIGLLVACGLGNHAAGDAARTAVIGAPAAIGSERPPLSDPFPITRFRVNADQFDEAVKSLGNGPLVRIPRTEFESRVQRAARVVNETRDPPRLLEAKYSAAFSGGDLAGDAVWVFLNRQAQPQPLPLNALRLAVANAKWEDGTPAILGSFGKGFPPGPILMVPPGSHTLKLQWSATGSGTAADRQFDLHVPTCASTALELEAPPEFTPTNPADVLQTGPFPAVRDPGKKLWRFRFGDRARLEFGIRGPSDSATAVAVGSLLAKYDLANGQLACTFDCDLRTTHGSTAEWVFHVPPGLTVTDVVANDRASWRYDAASHILNVGLRQATRGGTMLITATGAIPTAASDLPLIRPLNGIGSIERLELRVPPDVELERLEPADFRIADSTLTADGSRVVSLLGTLLPPAPANAVRRMPRIAIAPAVADYTTTETLDWQADADRIRFSVQVDVRVRRGPLFRIGFRTPPGYTLDRVSSTPDDAVLYAGPNADGAEVEFAHPVAAGQRVELRFEFRGPPLPRRAATFELPAFAPRGAAEREGRLTLSATPDWRLGRAESGAAEIAPNRLTRTYLSTVPVGRVSLTPLAPAFTAAVESWVERRGGARFTNARYTLTPTVGQLTEAHFLDVGSEVDARTWRFAESSNGIASARSFALASLFPPLTPIAPLHSLACEHLPTADRVWSLQFTQPATQPVIIETTARHPENAREGPNPTPLGATALRTQQTAAAFPNVPAGGSWSFEGMHLITLVAGQHQVVCGGSIRTRGGAILPLGLPAGSEVISACIGGLWLEPGRCLLHPGNELHLPLPYESGSVRFEVRYRLPVSGQSLARMSSPTPSLPGETNFTRWWVLPKTTVALWPLDFRTAPDEGSHPILLGDSVDQFEPDLRWYRIEASDVVTVATRYADAAGFALAAVLAVLGWWGARVASRFAGIVLLFAVLASGVAHGSGPSAWQRIALPPLVAAIAGAAAVTVARGWPRARIQSRPAGFNAVPAVLISGLLIAPAFAQTPITTDAVLILSEPGGEMVVAPQSLLDRLDHLAKRPEPALVVGAASYSGEIDAGLARFTARFAVHSLLDGESRWELPLADARLERATVGGQPAQPVATQPGVYVLPLPGRGLHEVELRFAVEITSSGPERELRFGIPESPETRIEFLAPLSARQLQAVGRIGEQSLTTEKSATRLRAALGVIRLVRIRWREGAGGTSATITAREGCIWDVSEQAHHLTSCYQLRVQSGAVSSLRFDVPANLEPTRIVARSLDSILVTTPVRDWSLGKETNGWRPLTIDLLAPTDGRMLLTIECEPKHAPSRQPVLRFLRPVGMMRESAVYGLRTSGVSTESIARTGVIDFAADAFTREFGNVPDLRLMPSGTLVAFSPRTGESADLRPFLKPSGEPSLATLETTWSVAVARAEGRGIIAWTGSEPVSTLDLAVPVTIDEVRGAEVASWAQAEGRVQVWFKRPVKESRIEWFGSAVVTAPAFDPPLPTISGMKPGRQTVRIRPAAGLGVRFEREEGWKPLERTGREWAFESAEVVPAPRVVFAATPRAAARGFGMAEFTPSDVQYRMTLEIPVVPNQPQHLILEAADLAPGAPASLDVPTGTHVQENPGTGGKREWNLEVPASPASTFRLTLTTSFAARGTLRLPAVDLRAGSGIPNPDGVVRAVGAIGRPIEVRWDDATEARGTDLESLRATWPGEADRLRRSGGSIWQVQPQASWHFPAAPAASPTPSTLPALDPGGETARDTPLSPPLLAVLPLVAWCGASVGLGAFFLRFPRTTWPEQVGLLGAMLGFAMGGEWAFGLIAYAAARSVWLFHHAFTVRR